METLFWKFFRNSRKRRILPLSVEIIKAMETFSKSSESNSSMAEVEAMIKSISQQVRKVAVDVLFTIPNIEQILNKESLYKIIDECICDHDISFTRDIGADSIDSVKALLVSKNKYKKEPAERSPLSNDFENLEKRVTLLEKKIRSALKDAPGCDTLNIEKLNINTETLIQQFVEIVDKKFYATFKSLIGPTTETTEKKVNLQSKVNIKSKIDCEEQSKDSSVYDNGHISLKHLSNYSSKEFENEVSKDKATKEKYRMGYLKKQYDMNTTYILKSETSAKLNQKTYFGANKVPYFKLSAYEENPLVQLISTKFKYNSVEKNSLNLKKCVH